MAELDNGFCDQFVVCPESGVGTTLSCRYSKQFKPITNHENLACTARINFNGMQLYILCSGFNGGESAAKFVMNRLAYEILQENPISLALSPKEIVRQLEEKFNNVAARYFETQCEALDERCFAKMNNSETNTDSISEIDKKIREGTTTILALRMNNDLYILNCGCSMAIVVQNNNSAERLNKILHENDDTFEIERFRTIGVEAEKVLNPTRAIGDLHRSYLYDEKDEFAKARQPPIISTPDVYHYVVDEKWKYLVLLSDGVVQNLKEVEVDDIPLEVAARLQEDHTATSTAQALVDNFARKHLDAFINHITDQQEFSLSCHREEMAAIFVKLPYIETRMYETYDSAISTMSSTIESIKPEKPYVDAHHSSQSENFRKMEKFLKGAKDSNVKP